MEIQFYYLRILFKVNSIWKRFLTTSFFIYVELENFIKDEISRMFERKRKFVNVEAKLDVGFLDHQPIEGESVYGEAYPFEKPPRVRIDIFPIDATKKDIEATICHELVHIKHPELEHGKEFEKKVKECITESFM